jgi:hypothetical protein
MRSALSDCRALLVEEWRDRKMTRRSLPLGILREKGRATLSEAEGMWLGRCQLGRVSVAFVLFALSTCSALPSGYKKLGGSASDSCAWGAMYIFVLDYFETSVHTRHDQNFFLPLVPPAIRRDSTNSNHILRAVKHTPTSCYSTSMENDETATVLLPARYQLPAR